MLRKLSGKNLEIFRTTIRKCSGKSPDIFRNKIWTFSWNCPESFRKISGTLSKTQNFHIAFGLRTGKTENSGKNPDNFQNKSIQFTVLFENAKLSHLISFPDANKSNFLKISGQTLKKYENVRNMVSRKNNAFTSHFVSGRKNQIFLFSENIRDISGNVQEIYRKHKAVTLNLVSGREKRKFPAKKHGKLPENYFRKRSIKFPDFFENTKLSHFISFPDGKK